MMMRWLPVLAACGGTPTTDATPALGSPWGLDVTVPNGWTRENIVIGKSESIELRSASGTVHLYFTDPDKVQPSADAYIRWKAHRSWNDEVTFSIADEAKLDDGWVARYELQTRLRPTPDALVYSTREIGGRHVDCVSDKPAPVAFADAIAICESAHFDPEHGSAATLPRPPPDWDVGELQVELPAGWQRSIDHDMLVLESAEHVQVTAYRQRDVPTVDAFLREQRITATDIVAKRVLDDGVVVTYRVGKSVYVRGSRTIATRNFRCSAIVHDAADAEPAATLCATLHR